MKKMLMLAMLAASVMALGAGCCCKGDKDGCPEAAACEKKCDKAACPAAAGEAVVVETVEAVEAAAPAAPAAK